ncbi:hypothetical protein CAOG_05940 [Capsaspora owczarzaki ATCC 30864]|uniref:Uncharacterized protein n=1 Tax=Capsaspora owczarzaki (strain ATCC 30864) TaxID=595528 RepID=A0A0D2UK56_CAPO3|nr:hypothetical protein CAOG_05940 [Capsaspora owczarzaki ATCC 30864]KJE95491.1 hypothetical protein CAOG_005940 [Capsaspora owczarzaki ATCC 30864]|eukprot:XP_004345530.1 hypothetical protein CAOG_05940 [Capsaspora owczarzaki ATCC 30864]
MAAIKKIGAFFGNIQASLNSGRQSIEDNLSKVKKLSLSTIKSELDNLIPVGGDSSSLDHVSVDAGSEIAIQFERDWVTIHSLLLETSTKAKTADDFLAAIITQCQARHDGMKNFQKQAATLGVIGMSLDGIHQSATQLSDQFVAVQSALDELEVLCDQIDHQRSIIAHFQQQEDKAKRAEDQKIKQEQAFLSEKHKAYSDQATLDLLMYKQTGSMAPVLLDGARSKTEQPSTAVAEVSIADLVDQSALQDFYADLSTDSRSMDDTSSLASSSLSTSSQQSTPLAASKKPLQSKPVTKVANVAPVIESPVPVVRSPMVDTPASSTPAASTPAPIATPTLPDEPAAAPVEEKASEPEKIEAPDTTAAAAAPADVAAPQPEAEVSLPEPSQPEPTAAAAASEAPAPETPATVETPAAAETTADAPEKDDDDEGANAASASAAPIATAKKGGKKKKKGGK